MTKVTNIGENIRFRRERLGWTKQRLGDELGLTSTQVYNYERGISKPTIDVALRLSDLFGCTVNELTLPVIPAHFAGEGETAEAGA